MSTILNALKKAKTDREKSGKASGPEGRIGKGGPNSPGESEQSTWGEPGRGERAARARTAAKGGRQSSADPASNRVADPLPRASAWTRSPGTASSPSARSSIPWLVVVVGLLAAVGGGGFVFFVLSHGSNGNGDSGAYAAASMAPAASADSGVTDRNPAPEEEPAAAANSAANSEAGPSSIQAVGSDTARTEEQVRNGDHTADLQKPKSGTASAASIAGNEPVRDATSHPPKEVASSSAPLVKIKPEDGGHSGDHEGGGKIPPGSIAPQSIEDYVNSLQQGSGLSVGVGAGAQQSTPTPYATVTPYPPMREHQGTSTKDNATSPPVVTPVRTPRPTPSIPPVPTLYPEGSHVMAIDLGLRIEGIMWDPSTPSALVNDRIVHEGDTVNQVKILKINRNDLTVEYHGRKLFAQY